jgi:hypothetical protein
VKSLDETMVSKFSSKIQVHHIGGRNGSQPFNLNPRFSQDYVLSLYDGDSSCEPSMVGDDGIERRAVVQVFAGKSGPTRFNINFDPYTSSIRSKNPDYDALSASMNFDYSNGDVRQPVGCVRVF